MEFGGISVELGGRDSNSMPNLLLPCRSPVPHGALERQLFPPILRHVRAAGTGAFASHQSLQPGLAIKSRHTWGVGQWGSGPGVEAGWEGGSWVTVRQS